MNDIMKRLYVLWEWAQLLEHYAFLFHLLHVSFVLAITKLPKHVADEKGMDSVLQVESTLTINTDMTENTLDLWYQNFTPWKVWEEPLASFSFWRHPTVVEGVTKETEENT
jgi:hypothetical protein